MDWDGKLYETSHSFVSAYGVDVLDMLGGISGKTVLDAGCGTGTLAAEAQGAEHGCWVWTPTKICSQ